jgi:hypothetical protein
MRGIRNVPVHYEVPVWKVHQGDNAEKREQPLTGVEVRESLGGVTLSDWMKQYAAHHKHGTAFAGIEDVKFWFLLAKLLTEALRPLHDERIVHGDLCPRNIVVRRTMPEGELVRPSMNEQQCFERAFFEERKNFEIFFLETHAAPPRVYCLAATPVDKSGEIVDAGTFRRKYDSPLIRYKNHPDDRRLVRDDNAAQWFAPTDIFSLGILLFELAFGWKAELGPFVEEDHIRLKVEGANSQQVGPEWFRIRGYEARKGNRQLKNALLTAGSAALAFRVKSGSQLGIGGESGAALLRMSEIILACLRSHTDRAVSDLQVLDTVRRQFDPGDSGVWLRWKPEDARPFQEDAANHALREVEERFNRFVEESLNGLPAIVRNLARGRGARFIYQLDSLIGVRQSAYFLQVRERSAMVDAMVNVINHLDPPERTDALLTPAFFRKENLGLYGRLTAALQLAALREVTVDWIILVNELHLTISSVQDILQRQREAYGWLCKFGGTSDSNYGVSYAIASPQEYEDVLRNQQTSIFLHVQPEATKDGKSQLQRLLIAPDYHGEYGTVAALRLWPHVEWETGPVDPSRSIRREAQHKRRLKLEETMVKFRRRKISVHSFHL